MFLVHRKLRFFTMILWLFQNFVLPRLREHREQIPLLTFFASLSIVHHTFIWGFSFVGVAKYKEFLEGIESAAAIHIYSEYCISFWIFVLFLESLSDGIASYRHLFRHPQLAVLNQVQKSKLSRYRRHVSTLTVSKALIAVEHSVY